MIETYSLTSSVIQAIFKALIFWRNAGFHSLSALCSPVRAALAGSHENKPGLYTFPSVCLFAPTLLCTWSYDPRHNGFPRRGTKMKLTVLQTPILLMTVRHIIPQRLPILFSLGENPSTRFATRFWSVSGESIPARLVQICKHILRRFLTFSEEHLPLNITPTRPYMKDEKKKNRKKGRPIHRTSTEPYEDKFSFGSYL